MGTQDRSDHLLKTALFDMEIPVRDIRAWAEAIHVVGATEREVDADVVVVMARALEVAAAKLFDQCRRPSTYRAAGRSDNRPGRDPAAGLSHF